MSQMLKSSGATAAATMASRLLGLVREIAYAAFMGKGWVADAFMLAFQIPNLFRRLLGEGALTAAFIPIFKQKEKTEGHPAMWHAANAVISGLLIASVVVVGLGVLAVTIALISGRVVEPKTLLMLKLLRVMLPYLLLVCLAAVFMGMLNARGHFFIPALGSAVLNVVMIASVFLIAPHMGVELPQQIFGLAVGVLIAGFAQAVFQMPLLFRDGFHYQWVQPWSDPTVRAVVKKMLPGIIGVAAFQINVLVANGFAFMVGEGIVSAFNYAVRLMELPQGLFGISLATYLLPTLSGLAAEKKYPEFRATLRDGIGYLVFINALATVLLVVLATPTIRLLFERGTFLPGDTPHVAIALMTLAPGLIAFSLVNIVGRAFYALGDTTTPMKISVFCLTANVLLTVPLVWTLRQAGLGIANTTTGIINVALLLFALRKKLKTLELAPVRAHLVSVVTCAFAAGLVAWGAMLAWDGWIGHTTLPRKMGEVFVPGALSAAVYFGLAMALRVPYAKDFLALVRRRRR
jgi:putative peptidoglycan lipid II flippase